MKQGQQLMLERCFDEAIAHFDNAVASGLGDAELLVSRGSCLVGLGWQLDAIDDFSRAIEMEPTDCNSYFQRAMARQAVGDVDGGREDIQLAIHYSKMKSSINDIYNMVAKEQEYETVADLYESHSNLLRMNLPDSIYELKRSQAKRRAKI